MNRSDPVKRLLGDPPLGEEQLNAIIDGLRERIVEQHGVDDEEQKRDVYLLLHPDVRRLLVQLGHEENRPMLLALLKTGPEETASLTELLKDYKEAKKLGKLVKQMLLGFGAFLSFVFAVIKGAPDVWEWVKGVLPR